MHAIITGGSGLIGRALATDLAYNGNEVTILSRRPEQIIGLPAGVRTERWDGCTAEGWDFLADGAEAIINGIDGTAYCPSIDFYRNPASISKNRIHLVWSRVESGMYSICYSNCTDITSNANFINPNSWCDSTGSPGFDVLSNDIEQQ